MSATRGGQLLGSAVLELRTDNTGLTRGMAQGRATAERETAALQSTVDRRLATTGQSMGRIGGTLTRTVTVPILAMGAAAADAAMHFQQAMEMIHTQAGASQREVNQLSGAVLDLARSGKVAAGPNELANALFRLEGAGLHGKQAMDALTASAQLAAVGNANVEDTAKTLAQTWFVGIKGAGSFRDTVGELNATVGAGDLRLQQLVDALGTGVLPAAKQAGLSLHDVTGALAVFGDMTNNVSGFTAQFATALHFMTNPSSKARAALGDLHLGALQLSEDLHKPQGLITALKDLKTHLEELPGGLHGVKANEILGNIFPGGRGRVLLVLMDQLDRLQGKMRQIAGTNKQFGEAVATTQQTAAFKIHASWAKIQADAVEIGDHVLPIVINRAAGVANIVGDVVKAFSRLPKGAQDAILTGGLILAGIGPAMKLLGLFTGGVGKLWSIAQIAARMATTGTFRAPSAAVGLAGREASMSVATMEVGTLVARSSLGGVGGSTVATAGAGAVGAEEGAAAGLGSRLLAGGARLLGVAGLAALAAPIAIPLVGALIKALQGQSYGQKLADSIFKGGFGGAFHKQLSDSVAHSLDQAHKIRQPNATFDPALRTVLGEPGLDAAATAKAVAQERAAGQKIAAALAAGWNQYKFQSEPVMLTQLRAKLKGMPPQTQAEGIKSALAFAQGLEKQGRLPRGAFQKMLTQVNQLFPGWQRQLGAWASMSALSFTRGLKFDQAEKNTKTALQKMRGDFPPVTAAMDKAKGDIVDKSAAAVKALLSIQRDGSAPARKLASADIAALRANNKKDLTAMASLTESRAKDMASSIKHHSADAANAAMTNFGKVASAVNRAMQSGLVSTQDGARLISQALNATLKAFGEKPVNIVGLTKGQLKNFNPQTFLGSAGTSGLHQGGLATGGYVGQPGMRGPDVVPAWLGVGEAVLNAPQQAVAERYLAPIGGLRGLYRRTAGSRHFAAGGVVTASEFGGPGDPGTGSTGYRGDNLYQHPDSYAELNMGHALGGLPYLAPLNVTYAGHTARLFKRDIGAGGPGLGGHTRAIDLWFQAAQKLGMPGLADVLINGAKGASVDMGQIHAPSVTGTGTIATIARAALGLAAKGANQYLSTHSPQVNVGAIGGGTPFQHGKYTFPLPGGSWHAGSVDQGWDLSAGAHTPEFALGNGVIVGHGINGFGQWAPILKLDDGNSVYYGHAGPGGELPVGTRVHAGQVIGEVGAGIVGISTGPHLEIGFYPPGSMGSGSAMKHALGYKAGGIVGYPANAHGGAKALAARVPARRPKAPRAHPHFPKQLKPLPGKFPLINRGLSKLSGLLSDRGQTAVLQDRYTATDSLFQAQHPDLQYVVTPSDGSPPYIDQQAVSTSLDELVKLRGWEAQLRDTYRQASRLIGPLLRRLGNEIAIRQARIAAIRRRILANVKKIDHLKVVLRGTKSATAKTALNKTLQALRDENQTLGGDRDKIGTGGTLGTLQAQLTALTDRASTAYQYHDDTVGLSGIGGNLNDAKVTLADLDQQIGDLSPSALSQQLTDAGSSASTSSSDTSALASLLSEQNTTLAQQLAVSQAQYGVLAGLPPFGGSFAAGGIVPGPAGAPRTIIAHGGEEYMGVGGSRKAANVRVILEDHRVRVLVNDVEQIVDQRLRDTARKAGRGLPGRAGAMR